MRWGGRDLVRGVLPPRTGCRRRRMRPPNACPCHWCTWSFCACGPASVTDRMTDDSWTNTAWLVGSGPGTELVSYCNTDTDRSLNCRSTAVPRQYSSVRHVAERTSALPQGQIWRSAEVVAALDGQIHGSAGLCHGMDPWPLCKAMKKRLRAGMGVRNPASSRGLRSRRHSLTLRRLAWLSSDRAPSVGFCIALGQHASEPEVHDGSV